MMQLRILIRVDPAPTGKGKAVIAVPVDSHDFEHFAFKLLQQIKWNIVECLKEVQSADKPSA